MDYELVAFLVKRGDGDKFAVPCKCLGVRIPVAEEHIADREKAKRVGELVGYSFHSGFSRAAIGPDEERFIEDMIQQTL